MISTIVLNIQAHNLNPAHLSKLYFKIAVFVATSCGFVCLTKVIIGVKFKEGVEVAEGDLAAA